MTVIFLFRCSLYVKKEVLMILQRDDDCWLDSLREVRIHTKTERGKGYVTDTWQIARLNSRF